MGDGESQLWLLWQLIERLVGNSNAMAIHLVEKDLHPQDHPSHRWNPDASGSWKASCGVAPGEGTVH